METELPMGTKRILVVVALVSVIASVIANHPLIGQSPAPAAGGTETAVDSAIVPSAIRVSDTPDVEDAEATTEAETKPYTETIPGTGVSFEMVPIPGGQFTMGSPLDEPGRSKDEGPPLQVALGPFWMGKHEVTWDEYDLWGMGLDQQLRELKRAKRTERDRIADAITMPSKPYADMSFGMGRNRYPAICMTQLAAKMYCKWLSAKTGRYYRLPTEAEWEYACRAGTTTAYSFGDGPESIDEYAWHYDNSNEKYQKVGQKKPNPRGLHDMHGNVAEWVLDQYRPNGYFLPATLPVRNPLAIPAEIFPRVVRGGSWIDDANDLRSAARQGSDSDWKSQDPQLPQSIWYHTDADFVGFRIVRPLHKLTAEEAKRYDLDKSQQANMAEYAEVKGLINGP
jgi:formylglycine-generating enzyme required for sulfatase activity